MAFVDYAALIALAALWGGSFLFIRAAASPLGPAVLIEARVAIAGLAVLAFVALLRRRPWPWLRAHAWPLLLLAVPNAAVPFFLIAWSELTLPASVAAILNSTTPMAGALLSAIWLREPLTADRLGGLLLGTAGVAVLVGWGPLPPGSALPVAAMLGAAACYAIGSVYAVKRFAGEPALSMAAGQNLAAALILLIPALAQGRPPELSPAAVGSVLALGLLSSALAYWLYFRLLQRVGATRTLTVTLLAPAFGVLWGRLFLGEALTWSILLGLLLIAASVRLIAGGRRRSAAAGA